MSSKHVSKPVAAALALLLFGSVPLVEQTLSGFDVDLGASAAAASEGKGKSGASGHGSGKAGGSGGSGGTGGPQYKGGKSGTATTSSITSDTGDEDSDKRGPKYMGGENANKPGDGDVRGGKPAWAQEGIPEGVELGRLNVARAPEHVLLRQYDEAFGEWDSDMLALYALSAADAAALLEDKYDSVVRYDSPLMNLALYKDVLFDGESALVPTPASAGDLAAIFLGSASDKTVEVTVGTVEAINLILGVNLDYLGITAAQLAEKAEAVRDAIETGHGE